jgi:hypothetical protein
MDQGGRAVLPGIRKFHDPRMERRDCGQTSLPNIDLCGPAIAQSLPAFRPETANDLDLRLKAALTHDGPSLTEVAIE